MERPGGRLSATSPRAGSWSRNKRARGDDLHTRSQNNSTPTAMDDLGHPTSELLFSDTEGDDDIEMVGLEEIAMTPQKAAHANDNDSESSDDEDDVGRGLLASGSRRRPRHAHTRSLSLSRGIDIWQQVKNIVIEVSGYPPAARQNPSRRQTVPTLLFMTVGIIFTGELMEKVPVSTPHNLDGFMKVIEPLRLGLEAHEADR